MTHAHSTGEPQLLAAIKEAIDELDPEGLLASGSPSDEYLPEALDFVACVQAGHSLTVDLVKSHMDRTL
jgi:hypothetical protein